MPTSAARLDRHDVVRLPGLVEERLERAIEAEEHEPTLTGPRLDPVLLCFRRRRRSGPKKMSIEPSSFAVGPVYVLTDGNG